jgi:hypothetical protein
VSISRKGGEGVVGEGGRGKGGLGSGFVFGGFAGEAGIFLCLFPAQEGGFPDDLARDKGVDAADAVFLAREGFDAAVTGDGLDAAGVEPTAFTSAAATILKGLGFGGV